MNDGFSGSVVFAKLFPTLVGVMGGALVFLFNWPKTAKEGFARLVAAGACSHFFGDPALTVAVRLFGDYVNPTELRPGMYMFVGGIGFFVIGAVVRWFVSREGKDVQELIQDIKK